MFRAGEKKIQNAGGRFVVQRPKSLLN